MRLVQFFERRHERTKPHFDCTGTFLNFYGESKELVRHANFTPRRKNLLPGHAVRVRARDSEGTTAPNPRYYLRVGKDYVV